MVLLLVNVFVPTEKKAYLGYLSLIGIIGAFVTVVSGWNAPSSCRAASGLRTPGQFLPFFKGIFLISAALPSSSPTSTWSVKGAIRASFTLSSSFPRQG